MSKAEELQRRLAYPGPCELRFIGKWYFRRLSEDAIAALEAAEAEIERLRGLQEPLAKQRWQAARAEIERLRETMQAALDWRGLDGDGITDPVRQQLIGAAPAPKPIVVGGNTKHCDDCGRHPDRCTCHKPQTQREET